MPNRTLCFNWGSLPGARKNKRRLQFEDAEDGYFVCPVSSCLHQGFKSKRGLRKHVNNQHEWYLFFDTQPEVKREDAQERRATKQKASTNKQPSFSIDSGSGAEFAAWLQTPCGGGKSKKDARQIAKRAMKYLMCCSGDNEDGLCAPETYIDCCVGSPTMLMKFLKVIDEEWGLKSSGAISYLHSVTDLLDFRKCHGVPDSTLRLFAATEVYLRRSKSSLYKKRNMEYSRDLSLESLIARKSWASLEEVEKVVPFHSERYREIFEKAGRDDGKDVTVSELAFATRFIITFLLLRVKCTRPMSLQYLTMEMLDYATEHGGFVDQTKFKTNQQFVFDTLKFSDDALDVINTYRGRIRPLCSPKCEFVIVTTSGTQYTSFCSAMSILTHEAIQRHITPTRYRAIVESESVERLDPDQQAVITQDQKHSSFVAKRFYQKKLSRSVAVEGLNAMRELVGENRDQHTGILAGALRGDSSVSEGEDLSVSPNTKPADDGEPPAAASSLTTPILSGETHVTQEDTPRPLEASSPADVNLSHADPITIDDESVPTTDAVSLQASVQVTPTDDIEVKKEEIRTGKRFLTFTAREDDHLREGFKKYGSSKKKWSDILKDNTFSFQEGRTRDSLRVRATSLGLEKKKSKISRK